MFESITEGFEKVFKKLRGRGKLSEKNIQDGMREIRLALLEADVNVKVAKQLIKSVTERAVGKEVIKSLTPGQQIIKIFHDELEGLMGPVDPSIPFFPTHQTVIMMAGLHGCGKTTTCAKLAKMLNKKNHKPLLVAADVQRPAAVDQLKVLGKQIDIPVYSEDGKRATKICQRAVKFAEKNALDVIILDTAGRLHIDKELMDELKSIRKKVKPHQIYLVCDAMTGQDAVNSAKEFNNQLELDGVILTKLDGDARGGAAISVKAVTGKPIKFAGVGEKLDEFEEFHPDRMASRILGMGDVVTLVEKAQEAIDIKEAEKMEKKIRKATFNFEDFYDQLQKIKKMGPISDILGMIPGLGSKLKGIDLDDSNLKRVEAIIQSMTLRERRHVDIINGSRRRRIANGSGTTVQEVNSLIKQFKQMKKMMKNISKMGKFMGKGFNLGF